MQRDTTISTETALRTPAGETLSPALAGGRTGTAGWDTSDLESFLVEAIARELGRRFGGNAVLNRLEASALLARHVAIESPFASPFASPSTAHPPRDAPPPPDFPSTPTSPTEQDIHR